MARITLNKSNFFHNLDIIKAQTQSLKKIALVLKDNAYGHGLLEMAQLAHEYGITKAVVRSNAEAQTIEEFFEYILVLADIPKVPSKKIRYTINDAQSIKEFPKGTLVELKVNTDMNRNGVSIDELKTSIELIEKRGLCLEAIFTHFSCADELNGNYERQKANFLKIKQNAPQGLYFHSCNSAALFREENFDEDMVRVGIAAYGCLDMPSSFKEHGLKPVLALYAKKISSRQISKGDSVGYGATFVSQSDLVVSNYDFGYGDGFLRANSNTYKTPEGIQIAGRISMDNSSFLSDKDEILIFNDAREVATFAKTISYEVLTSLKEHIKREII
ncbi:Alanine racemase [hydrothermal vent metagenome]|uniref:Alanine racemase n=1 Tax=hydrothermal vent metagenome TaxID=652676 RepID=A0A1W1B9D2_9ZZZZ